MNLDAFEFYDCWLLLSIGFNRRGTPINQIVASGDMYNHAIFTLDELNYGMSKLIENGYVEKRKDRFVLTRKAREFYKANKKSEGCIDALLRLSPIFQKENIKQDCKLICYFTENLDAQDPYRRYQIK